MVAVDKWHHHPLLFRHSNHHYEVHHLIETAPVVVAMRLTLFFK
jgi:hypothetical protein